jgi:hypothetical protein
MRKVCLMQQNKTSDISFQINLQIVVKKLLKILGL